mgnify:FL=1
MLDAAYEWMKNLSFYLIIMTAVIEVLPGNTYRKYIRFFTGLVMILLVVTPILKLTGSYGQFQAKYQRREQEFQTEIERQKRVFEEADVFEFLPEEYLQADTENGRENTENRAGRGGVETEKRGIMKVEDIRIGEDEEPDMESDTFRK